MHLYIRHMRVCHFWLENYPSRSGKWRDGIWMIHAGVETTVKQRRNRKIFLFCTKIDIFDVFKKKLRKSLADAIENVFGRSLRFSIEKPAVRIGRESLNDNYGGQTRWTTRVTAKVAVVSTAIRWNHFVCEVDQLRRSQTMELQRDHLQMKNCGKKSTEWLLILVHLDINFISLHGDTWQAC